jgi:hypothetical protein
MFALKAEQSLRVEHARGLQIRCVRGVLWITREGDPLDRFLAHGETLLPTSKGMTIVTALEDAVLEVSEALRTSTVSGWLGWMQRKPLVRQLTVPPQAMLTCLY